MIEVKDGQLYVSVTGSGPPVLFLHGGLNHFDRSFAAQIPYFSGFRTVIGIDQRGHGHSPDSSARFSYRDMAQDTAAVLQKLGLGPVDVVGHSDGGNVALLLASSHPELVRRLVVSGANYRGDMYGPLAYLKAWLMSRRRFLKGLAPEDRDDFQRTASDGLQRWPDFAAKTQSLWLTFRVIDPEELRSIHAPVLVMAGERDVIPREHTEALFRSLGIASLCVLPDTGHGTPQEHPEQFNRIVDRFLSGDPQPCQAP